MAAQEAPAVATAPDAKPPAPPAVGGKKRKRGYIDLKSIPATKEEVEGWETMSKNGLKRALKGVRARKLAEIKEKRRQEHNAGMCDSLFTRAPGTITVGIPHDFTPPPPPPPGPDGTAPRVGARTGTRLRIIDSMKSAPGLLLDHCPLFEEYMKHAERASLAQQLTHMYSANRSAGKPLWLGVAGVTPILEAAMLARGGTGWAMHAFREEYTAAPALAGRTMVYLSAEAEEVLTELKPDVTYVVGGLVDRNRHVGAALARAVEGGLPTARLPLSEHVDVKHSPVLTCNHVMQILLLVWNGVSWKDAITRTLPTRKSRARQMERQAKALAKKARLDPGCGGEGGGEGGSTE